MKKVVSLFLALVMVFAMATTASAATYTDCVVGETGNTTSYEDGWTAAEFEAATETGSDALSLDITVSSGSLEHRYAVDISWDDMILALYGEEMVWDVNELEYVAKDGEANSSFVDYEAKTFDITVTNRSDMKVEVSAEATVVDEDVLEITTDADDSAKTVAAATPGIAAKETVTVSIIHADGKTWSDVVDYYSSRLSSSNTQITVGTVSLTISKPTT